MIASLDVKFKTNKENMENILQHYGLRKIQSTIYAGDMTNDEREELCEKIKSEINKKDSVLVLPLCQKCFSKKQLKIVFVWELDWQLLRIIRPVH